MATAPSRAPGPFDGVTSFPGLRSARRAARVAVIGAGAAGLTAAHALTRAGYRSVTVLEREGRVGGKCLGFHHDGRSYELGAAIVTHAYATVRALMKEHGVRAKPKPSGIYLDLASRTTRLVVPAVRGAAWLGAGPACARFAMELLRERGALRPGHAHVPDRLMQPFTSWANGRGLELAAKMAEPWVTAFGYGYLDEVPAAYVLKYARLWGPPLEILEGGYQALWEAVAQRLDVRLGTNVRRVVRTPDEVVVETDQSRLVFDALVVACPLDAALGFLDATAEERALFSRIVTNEYRVVAASVTGMPREARYMFIPENIDRRAHGEPMFWYRRWRGSDVHLFYSYADDGAPMASTVEKVEAMVRRLGGKLARVHRDRSVRYFPHVSSDDMRGGFYRRLEALQGERRTFYTGEIFDFSAVESVAAYSRALVDRFFEGQRETLAGARLARP